jgi:hypothetical protein
MEFICESDTTNKTKQNKKKEKNHTQRMIHAADFVGGTFES